MARRIRTAWIYGIFCAAAFGAAVHAESVEVQVGFSSSVVASHYAPIWVHVADVDKPFEGIVRITQLIGDPDADPEPVVIERDFSPRALTEKYLETYRKLSAPASKPAVKHPTGVTH